LTKPHHDDSLRLRMIFALAALAVALFVPAVASAQDPAGDQYAPTAPTGGTGTPNTTSGSPVQDSSPDTSGTQAGDTSSSSPTATTDAADGSAPTATATTGDQSVNKRQRTLDQIAADADQQRQQRAESTGGSGEQTTGQQLSAEPASGSGMGTYLLIALGLVLLWAVVAGIINFRRREGSGGEPRAAGGNGKSGQPA
jgi:hypothetical protein